MTRYLKFIGVFAATTVLMALLLEGYVRGGRIESALNTDVDPNIGRIRKANAQYIIYNEGMAIGEFNKYGYIGPDYPRLKPDNTLRIALLGDSYVEGLYMSEERHFRTLLEASLQEKYPNKEVQILNFGRSGFDLSDMYAYENTFVEQFNPDFVLYFINPFDFIQVHKDPLVPYWDLKNDSLVLNKGFARGEKIRAYRRVKGLLQQSALLQMLKNAYNLAKSPEAFSIVLDKLAPPQDDTHQNLKKNLRVEDITKQRVSKEIMRRLTARQDAIIVNRDEEAWPREIARWANVDSVRFVDLGSLFVQLQQRGHRPRFWKSTQRTGHWNVETQEYVTAFLSNRLDSMLMQHESLLGR